MIEAIYNRLGNELTQKYIRALSYDYAIEALGENKVFWQPLKSFNQAYRTMIGDIAMADINCFVDEQSIDALIVAALAKGHYNVREQLIKGLSQLATPTASLFLNNNYHGVMAGFEHVVGRLVYFSVDEKTAVLINETQSYLVNIFSLYEFE